MALRHFKDVFERAQELYERSGLPFNAGATSEQSRRHDERTVTLPGLSQTDELGRPQPERLSHIKERLADDPDYLRQCLGLALGQLAGRYYLLGRQLGGETRSVLQNDLDRIQALSDDLLSQVKPNADPLGVEAGKELLQSHQPLAEGGVLSPSQLESVQATADQFRRARGAAGKPSPHS